MTALLNNRLLLSGLLFVAFCGLLWSGLSLQASYKRSNAAQTNLQSCERLAAEILQKRKAPQQATDKERSEAALFELMQESLHNASLPTTALKRVDSRAPKRLTGSDYLQHQIEAELQAITMQQLIEFLLYLNEHAPEFEVSDLHLSVARKRSKTAETSELWEAEVTLTYLIYAATIRRPSFSR